MNNLTALPRFGMRNNNGLTIDQIARIAPSVLATEPAGHLSARYVQVPTIQIVETLMQEGFQPVEARQGISRTSEKRDVAKHLIRLRRADITQMSVGDTTPEIVLFNSHDGTSAYRMFAGLYRLACKNGLVVNVGELFKQSIPHRGRVLDVARESADALVRVMPQLPSRIEALQGLSLPESHRLAFAEAASRLRWEPGQVEPQQLLRVRRFEDRGNDAWRTLNVIQENVTGRGVTVRTQDENGKISRRRAREVTAVDRDVGLNAALWTLAERFRELSQSARMAA